MATGFIYVITNDINGKQYVGKTRETIEKRFKTHLEDSFRARMEKRPLYAAMNKYGREHFSIEKIEECALEVIDIREQYWISQLNTYHNGYNATLGGDGTLLYDYEAMIEDYNNGLLVYEIANKYGCCVDTVTIALSNNGINSKLNAEHRQNKIGIIQLDFTNNEINNFLSCSDAARWLIDNHKTTDTRIESVIGHILQAARGQRKTAYHYKWKLENEINTEPKLHLKKAVQCLETNQIFTCSKEAAQWCGGLKDGRSIRAACNGAQKSAGKHPITGEKLHWKYIEE